MDRWRLQINVRQNVNCEFSKKALNSERISLSLSCYGWTWAVNFTNVIQKRFQHISQTNFYPLPKAYTLKLKKHIFTKFCRHIQNKISYLHTHACFLAVQLFFLSTRDNILQLYHWNSWHFLTCFISFRCFQNGCPISLSIISNTSARRKQTNRNCVRENNQRNMLQLFYNK